MNEVLAIGLQAMQADAARVDQAGVNLANVLTPAYKRGVAVQQAAFTRALGDAQAARGAGAASAVSVQVDPRAATLTHTGQPLDVAIAGRGWFEVMTAEGPAYTRRGQFAIDARGRLITQQGDPVMGEGGEIVVGMKRPAISRSGQIRDAEAEPGAAPLARLRIVDFEPGAQPQRFDNGLFAAMPGLKQLEAVDVQVRQGALENANVDTGQEMTALVVAMRHFESMQKVVQALDDMLGTAIRKLGENA